MAKGVLASVTCSIMFAVVAERPALLWLIAGLGLISALGLSSHFLSSCLLSFVLFGLLIYVEPVLLVVALLGERIAPGQWLTYLPIWAALAVLFGEGVIRGMTARREVHPSMAISRS